MTCRLKRKRQVILLYMGKYGIISLTAFIIAQERENNQQQIRQNNMICTYLFILKIKQMFILG